MTRRTGGPMGMASPGARWWAAGVGLALLSAHPAPASGQQARPPAAFGPAWRELAADFHRRMDAEGVVGGSVWFVQGDTALARAFHGYADLATRRRIDERTIYHWASITKTFTAIAIMQLRDRGRLRLDDSVVHYLPELRAVHDSFGSIEAVTIRQLLSHAAGFRNPTWPWGGDQPWHPHEPTEWSQLVAMMPYTEILFQPGSRFSYSNLGIIFLGRIIEQLSGDDFEVYVDKNILKPLGMYRSYFDLTPYLLLKDRSNNYTVKDGQPIANGLDFDTGITTSNGGLNAPIPDMVKYVSFLIGMGDRRLYDGVLRRASLEEMWRRVLPIEPSTAADSANRDGWRVSIGLAYFIYQRGDATVVGHTGGQKSFSTFFYVDPAAGVAAIAAFNTIGEPKPDIGGIFTALKTRLCDVVFPLFRREARAAQR